MENTMTHGATTVATILKILTVTGRTNAQSAADIAVEVA